MNQILREISYYLKPSIIRKSGPYLIPIFLGVLFKLNTILLFILPITAIKSISEGTLLNKLVNIFNYFYIPKPNDESLFLFFLTIILLALLSFFIIKDFKNFFIWKIKNKIYLNARSNNKLPKEKFYDIKSKFTKIDRLIKINENIVFCSTLIILIILYDFQIALITLLGGLIYFKIIDYQNLKINSDFNNSSSLVKKDRDNKIVDIINNGKEKKVLKTLISTLVMLAIMSLIYLRTNSEISIIFIFLVRIYQNNMLNSIYDYKKKKIWAYIRILTLN